MREARLSDAFRRVEAGEDVPPPPAALVRWTQVTSAGILAGLVVGAVAAHKREPVPDVAIRAGDGGGARAAWRDNRELIMKRQHRVLRAAAGMGARVGAFCGFFSAVELGLAEARDVDDPANVVAAGALSGAVFGVSGGVRGLVLGGVLGGLVSVPFAAARFGLESFAAPDAVPSKSRAAAERDARDKAAAQAEVEAVKASQGQLVTDLEASLAERAKLMDGGKEPAGR